MAIMRKRGYHFGATKAIASFFIFSDWQADRPRQIGHSPCRLQAQRKSQANRHGSSGSALVGKGGFEPPKSLTTDLQSAPFGHSGIPPYSVRCAAGIGAGRRTRTPDLLITNIGKTVRALVSQRFRAVYLCRFKRISRSQVHCVRTVLRPCGSALGSDFCTSPPLAVTNMGHFSYRRSKLEGEMDQKRRLKEYRDFCCAGDEAFRRGCSKCILVACFLAFTAKICYHNKNNAECRACVPEVWFCFSALYQAAEFFTLVTSILKYIHVGGITVKRNGEIG